MGGENMADTTNTSPPCWAGPCPRCGGPATYNWQEIRDGRRQVRASCRQCGTWLGFAPQREPYIGLANAAACPTVTIDALALAEDEDVELMSDGSTVWCEPHGKASERLRQMVRERGRLLASLLGDTTK
jgi:hypothetical protein